LLSIEASLYVVLTPCYYFWDELLFLKANKKMRLFIRFQLKLRYMLSHSFLLLDINFLTFYR